jgi:chemotaxis protein MotB
MASDGGGHGHGHDDEPHEEHEEHVNHEAWVIPYADLLTLLMAMFIALFAMSSVDKDKFKELSIGFNEALGGGKLTTGVFAPEGDSTLAPGDGSGGSSGSSQTNGGAVGPADQATTNSLASLLEAQARLQTFKATERENLQEVQERLEGAAAEKGLGGKLKFDLLDDGLHVTIVTDEVLFDSGKAAIQPDGEALLALIAQVLADVENPILIGGHTDDVPIDTVQFPSNWELSGGRASAVLRFLADHGLAGADLQATGYADTRPIESNDTEAGRAKNRRVEILIQSRVVGALLDANGLSTPAEDADATSPVLPNLIGGSVDQAVDDIVGNLAAEA